VNRRLAGMIVQGTYMFSKVLTDTTFLTSQTEGGSYQSVLNRRLDMFRAAFDQRCDQHGGDVHGRTDDAVLRRSGSGADGQHGLQQRELHELDEQHPIGDVRAGDGGTGHNPRGRCLLAHRAVGGAGNILS